MGQTPFHSVRHSKRIFNIRDDVSKETNYQINKLIVSWCHIQYTVHLFQYHSASI